MDTSAGARYRVTPKVMAAAMVRMIGAVSSGRIVIRVPVQPDQPPTANGISR